ncbi:hypothetical protein M440DRAFT_1396177 [Trichoderma longibrachiatum ATCC 18648]|uniref:Secreted protein n=1 Tax=Trichoderma longibrachiatum ATCC 18648 TaxID=983965 RepID=A0A2T4CHI2_TRILO|nr:hypothetical protein M440DRAFT_1396177 [Trichoderma longibrachiatum ATCC 18648]
MAALLLALVLCPGIRTVGAAQTRCLTTSLSLAWSRLRLSYEGPSLRCSSWPQMPQANGAALADDRPFDSLALHRPPLPPSICIRVPTPACSRSLPTVPGSLRRFTVWSKSSGRISKVASG